MYGTAPWLQKLKDKATKLHKKLRKKGAAVRKDKLASHHGGRVTGKRKALKKSEHYPKEFCRIVAAMHRKQTFTM